MKTYIDRTLAVAASVAHWLSTPSNLNPAGAGSVSCVSPRRPQFTGRRVLAPLLGATLVGAGAIGAASASPLPVLLVIADRNDFYYQEYGDTRGALEASGVAVQVAATTTARSLPHPNTGEPAGTDGGVAPDVALADVDPGRYAAVVFVGGWGSSMYQYAYNDPGFDGTVDNYYAHGPYNGDDNLQDGQVGAGKRAANQLINEFLAADKPVAGICHGVTVLAWARVDGASPLAGRRVAVPFIGAPATYYEGRWYGNFELGQREQVVANGGLATTESGQTGDPSTVSDDVIVDGRIITAENYDSAWTFGLVIAHEVRAVPGAVSWDGLDLVVEGTAGDDSIEIWNGTTSGQVLASVNGQTFGPFILPAGGVVVARGGAGNDRMEAKGARVPVILMGGPGNDALGGGWGRDVIVGGDGDDVIEGREGRDLLIGGLGRDSVAGGAGEDLLIGGVTSYDENREALRELAAAWFGAPSIEAGVAGLIQGLESGVRLVWGETVLDDAVRDSLTGGSQRDAVFLGRQDAWRGDSRDLIVRAP